MAESDEVLESSRTQKREFLQREIVEAGFQPSDFIEYCNSLQGSDIDSWSMEDLQACVCAFKLNNQPAVVSFDCEEETKQSEESENAKIDTVKYVSPQEEFEIPTRTILPTELFITKKVEVSLLKYDVMPGGFLSSPFLLISLKTNPLGWSVMRRFADFLALRKVLISQFPGVFVAPLVDKTKTDPESVSRLIPVLMRFIDSLVRTPLFLCSVALTSFLRDDRIIFEGLIKNEQQRRKLETTASLWSLSGSVKCLATFYSSKSVADYCSQVAALQKKLADQFSAVNVCLQLLSAQITQVSETCRQLSDLQNLVPDTNAQKHIYQGLENVFALWGKQESDLASLIRYYGEFPCRGEWMEMEELSKIVQTRDTLGHNAERIRDQLAEKKEKLWTAGDVGKWELAIDAQIDKSSLFSDKSRAIQLMLPNGTREANAKLHFFAYHNYQLKTEFARTLSNSARLSSLNISEFYRLFDENRQVFCLALRDFQGRLSAFY